MIEYKCPKCGRNLVKFTDGYRCQICRCTYDTEEIEGKKEKKMPCSGLFCCINRNFEPSECLLYDECEFYTPEKDFSGLDAIIEMAEKEFNITSESQKKKLKILFNAYVAEYLAITCKL